MLMDHVLNTEQYGQCTIEKKLAAVTAERDKLKRRAEIMEAFIDGEEPGLPWPETVWPMTTAEYVMAVPDPQLRTAISGYLMREGWRCAAMALREQMQDALAESEIEGDEDANPWPRNSRARGRGFDRGEVRWMENEALNPGKSCKMCVCCTVCNVRAGCQKIYGEIVDFDWWQFVQRGIAEGCCHYVEDTREHDPA